MSNIISDMGIGIPTSVSRQRVFNQPTDPALDASNHVKTNDIWMCSELGNEFVRIRSEGGYWTPAGAVYK